MGLISLTLPTDGSTADVADVNVPFTTLATLVNGQLDNANIATLAAIAGSKLADASIPMTKLVNVYKFAVYRNGAQNCGNGSLAKVNFDTELYDTNNNFDNATNFRYVAPVAGYYHFDTYIKYVTGGSSASPILAFYKNGTIVRSLYESFFANNITITIGGGIDIQLAANDYIEVFLQGLGGAITIGSANNGFNGHLISTT